MPFPKTETELSAAGYVFINTGHCRDCKAEIAWYRTPKNSSIPLEEGTLEPHWSTCPFADNFRRAQPGTGAFSNATDGYKKGTK